MASNFSLVWLDDHISLLWVNFNLSFSDKEEDIPGEEESSDHETAQEKRLRLAKQYLAQLEKEGDCSCYSYPSRT